VLKQTAIAARERIKKRGRPCKRWWYKVENNLNIMGINNRQAMARDSWEWGRNMLTLNLLAPTTVGTRINP